MTLKRKSILFLGKQHDPHSQRALELCQSNFSQVLPFLGEWGEPLPAGAKNWAGDYIISYLSRWVVPEDLLKRGRIASFNFHPASPDYPGIGCTNFALYEGASEYGATCHHMTTEVDAGDIISTKKFPVLPDDCVETLLAKTYDALFILFQEVMTTIINDAPLPVSSEKWTRPAFLRKQFDQLCRITPDMSNLEVEKRIRATSYGVWQPTVTLHGHVFKLDPAAASI